MSKLNPLYEKWDVKFFWREHIRRMRFISKPHVSYQAFYTRLKNWMSLREAIYTPSNTNMNRYNMKPKRWYKKFKSNLHFLRIRFISFPLLMKRWNLDIHLSDEELDKQWHKEWEFIEQWKKDAQFLGITWTWAIMWVSEIYSKNDKLYLIPNWMGVYEIIDSDLHNLKKVNA